MFEKGVPQPGRGRPKGTLNPQAKLRNAIAEAANMDEVLELLSAMRLKGLEGDSGCAKLYMEYSCGKPDANINLSGGLDWAGVAGEID